ncbi:hypothetical protein [Deinococcus petrolearius]|uniref:Uncharacterized protein n=1 Tax=Deinococcus petrolearius TaxID=1751295 RepID=A0ABW1DQS4_9DEIO
MELGPVDERLSAMISLGHLPELTEGHSPRALRRAAMEEALMTDVVLCEGQLRRYFGADEADLSLFPSRAAPVQPVHGRDYRVSVRFFSLIEDTLRKAPPTLGHFCGTAEMRLAYGARPAEWRIGKTADERLAADPDAVYATPGGLKVAVEYDLGTYSGAKMLNKIGEYFETYDAVMWGCPSELRIRRLRARVVSSEALAHRQKPFGGFTVEWWRGSPQLGLDGR